jgi:hypothetical protein
VRGEAEREGGRGGAVERERMGLEREMMRFKRERLVGSWRRLREERVAGDSDGDGASPAVMVDKPRTFAVPKTHSGEEIWWRWVFR